MAGAATSSDAPPRKRRQAIVFVPGMGDTWVNQSISTVGRKLASALDNEAATSSATFDVEIWEENYGPNDSLIAPGCTIHRKDGERESALIDVYRLDSVRELRAGWDNRSLLVKTLLPLYLLFAYTRVALRRNKQKGKSFRERFQFFYAVAVGLSLSLYIGLVTYSILALLVPAPALNGLAERVPAGVTLALTIVGLKKADFVAQATSGATGYIAVMRYFRYGANRENLVGNLARLIQHVQERKDVEYERIDIVAYSFGTIVSLDALFPPPNRDVGTFKSVGQLVTIGCPFDFTRTYWPNYFADRLRPADYGRPAPLPWLNIYLPIDILSSNFSDSPTATDPEVGIPTRTGDGQKPTNLIYAEPSTREKLGLTDFLVLMGLQSHDFYWGSAQSSELGVFPQIVRRLYANQPALA